MVITPFPLFDSELGVPSASILGIWGLVEDALNFSLKDSLDFSSKDVD